MGKKDILFLCQFFYPEHNSSATLPFDTAKHFAEAGYSVDALVGYPKEYSDRKNLPLRETVSGVGIRRLRYLQLRRTGTLGRLINYFSFTFHALLKTRLLKKYELAIVYSNPPVLPIVPLLAKKLYGTKLVFVAYDVYPEVAYASGALTPDGLISKLMARINRALYKNADCVVALTDEMRGYLLENRPELSEDRIVTVANWAHETRTERTAAAYEAFGFRPEQFIVSYFGNMGTCQDVETMLSAAELLKEDDRIRFLIVGHGNKKELVADRIRDRGLQNVLLLDFLTGEAFRQAVAISDCSIVSLEKSLYGTCAPSKYYSYLQGGQPVLAVVDGGSYLAEEVQAERIGFAVPIGDGAALRDAIGLLASDASACAEMGARAKALYDRCYAYEIAMQRYDAMLRKIGLQPAVPHEEKA